jgi:hypothetical protein
MINGMTRVFFQTIKRQFKKNFQKRLDIQILITKSFGCRTPVHFLDHLAGV